MTTPSHFLLAALLLLVPAQEPPGPIFHAESDLVVIRTQVFDKDTRQPLSGLARSDFEVLDESSPSELSLFDNSPLPLSVVLLADVSGGYTNQNINSCSLAFYRSLTPEDEIALMSFHNGDPRLRTEFTSDEKAVLSAWGLVFGEDRNRGGHTGNTSRMVDAIDAAARYLLQSPRVRRPAIVVVTHNREAKSKTTRDVALEELLDSSSALEAIVVPQENPRLRSSMGIGVFGRSKASSRKANQPEYLEDFGSIEPFAAAAGGQTLRLDLGGAGRAGSSSGRGADWAVTTIGPLIQDLISRLRSQYTLGIRGASADERQFRRLTVRLSESARQHHPNAVIHARAGYWTEPRPSAGSR